MRIVNASLGGLSAQYRSIGALQLAELDFARPDRNPDDVEGGGQNLSVEAVGWRPLFAILDCGDAADIPNTDDLHREAGGHPCAEKDCGNRETGKVDDGHALGTVPAPQG